MIPEWLSVTLMDAIAHCSPRLMVVQAPAVIVPVIVPLGQFGSVNIEPDTENVMA